MRLATRPIGSSLPAAYPGVHLIAVDQLVSVGDRDCEQKSRQLGDLKRRVPLSRNGVWANFGIDDFPAQFLAISGHRL